MKAKYLSLCLLLITPHLSFSMEPAGADGSGGASKDAPTAWGWAYQKYATNAPALLGGATHYQFLHERYIDGTLFPTAVERPLDVSNMIQRAIKEAGALDLTQPANREIFATTLKIAGEVSAKNSDITIAALSARDPLTEITKLHKTTMARAKALHKSEKAKRAAAVARHAARLASKTTELEEAKRKAEAELETEKQRFLEEFARRKAKIEADKAAALEALQHQQREIMAKVDATRKHNDEVSRTKAAQLAAMMRQLGVATGDDMDHAAAEKYEAAAFAAMLSEDEDED